MKAEPFNRHVLQSLLKTPPGDYASIYLAPVPIGVGLPQGPIAVKNAATGIEERLADRGRNPAEVQAFTSPLLHLAEDESFWRSPQPGMGLFLSEQGMRAYRLRGEPRDGWWLGDRYRLLPLLSPSEAELDYYLLAVSANRVTLYEGSNDALTAVPVAGMVENLKEIVRVGETTALAEVVNTRYGATFHGQGPDIDRRKDELNEFFRYIEEALRPRLAGAVKPLLFAGVEYMFPIFRHWNKYPHLVDEPLSGNPERMGLEELRGRAAELLRPRLRKPFEADAARYEDVAGARRTTERLSAILSDAHRGMVDALFAAEGGSIWGRFDPADESLVLTTADDPIGCDLYDLAAHQTLAHGGKVHVVAAAEVPHGGTIAALLRYAPPLPE